MNKTGYTEKERSLVEVAFNIFIQSVKKVMDAEQIGYIVKAYELAFEKYDGKKTLSGGIYLLKLIEMADIAVNEIGLRSKTIVGIFLHGITTETDVTIDYIKEHFGERAASRQIQMGLYHRFERIRRVQYGCNPLFPCKGKTY